MKARLELDLELEPSVYPARNAGRARRVAVMAERVIGRLRWVRAVEHGRLVIRDPDAGHVIAALTTKERPELDYLEATE